MKVGNVTVVFMLFTLMFAVDSFAGRSVQTIETRPGVTLSYLLDTPDVTAKGVAYSLRRRDRRRTFCRLWNGRIPE